MDEGCEEEALAAPDEEALLGVEPVDAFDDDALGVELAQNGRRAYPSPSTPSRNAVDAVQDAHSLMAHYPFASATPATHGM